MKNKLKSLHQNQTLSGAPSLMRTPFHMKKTCIVYDKPVYSRNVHFGSEQDLDV